MSSRTGRANKVAGERMFPAPKPWEHRAHPHLDVLSLLTSVLSLFFSGPLTSNITWHGLVTQLFCTILIRIHSSWLRWIIGKGRSVTPRQRDMPACHMQVLGKKKTETKNKQEADIISIKDKGKGNAWNFDSDTGVCKTHTQPWYDWGEPPFDRGSDKCIITSMFSTY